MLSAWIWEHPLEHGKLQVAIPSIKVFVQEIPTTKSSSAWSGAWRSPTQAGEAGLQLASPCVDLVQVATAATSS